MTLDGGNFNRSLITTALLLTFFGLAASRPAAAQGRGNGGGGGGGSSATGWIEQFNDSLAGIQGRGWGIEDTGSPDSQFGVPGTGVVKSFERDNDYVRIDNGILRLKLNLTDNSGTIISTGSMVYTQQTYGYGTFEWCARMSSTASSPTASGQRASGGISAGFIYVLNSKTEIDYELARSASSPDWHLYMANWSGLSRNTFSVEINEDSPPNDFHATFKIYKFVWTRDYIQFLVNDGADERSLAFHTTNIPRTAAHVMANHWGSNNPTGFGGPADTTKPDRYFYVDWVRYTPPFGIPVGGTVPCGPAGS